MRRPLLSSEFEHSLDPKGRVTLPARFREYFSDGAVTVRMFEHEPCLRIYSREDWEKFDEEYLAALDAFGDEAAVWQIRQIYGSLDEVEPDRQGRILLSAQKIKELGFGGKVLIRGARTHIEIWDPGTYTELATQKLKERGGNA
jgi:MraZ protein